MKKWGLGSTPSGPAPDFGTVHIVSRALGYPYNTPWIVPARLEAVQPRVTFGYSIPSSVPPKVHLYVDSRKADAVFSTPDHRPVLVYDCDMTGTPCRTPSPTAALHMPCFKDTHVRLACSS